MFTSTTFIFLLVTVWTVSAEVGMACNNGGTIYGNDCFSLGRGNITSYDALYKCEDNGLRQAVSYYLTPDAIKYLLKNTPLSGVRGAWLENEERVYSDVCTFLDAEKDWQLGVLPCNYDDGEMLYVCYHTDVFLTDCFGSSCYTITDEKYDDNPCKNGIGYIARIESLEENEYVAEFLKNASIVADENWLIFYDFEDPIYIDGNDRAKEGEWVFSNGDKMPIFNWAKNEPNNNNNEEHCITIRPGTNEWNDLECGRYGHHYLCESDNIDMSG